MNLFEDTYQTLSAPGQGEFRDRGSKFLGFAFPVLTEAEVKAHVQALKKAHPGANHCCYAFRIGPDKQFFRANDDGEPSGTAGRPILGQIQSKDLTNVLVAVVRYFGGTLLGVSGLIQAYRQAALTAIENGTIVEQTVDELYLLQFPYEAMNEVMRIGKDHKLPFTNTDYGENCQATVAIRKNEAERVVTLFRKVKGLKATFVQEG